MPPLGLDARRGTLGARPGEAIGALSISEPGSGSDAVSMSTRSKSSTSLMPPPTVSGIKIVEATRVRISVNSLRPSEEAVMS